MTSDITPFVNLEPVFVTCFDLGLYFISQYPTTLYGEKCDMKKILKNIKKIQIVLILFATKRQ